MIVKDILKKWLKDNGYDGLCARECGCGLREFMPCSCDGIQDCRPAYFAPCSRQRRRTCELGGDCPSYIVGCYSPRKPRRKKK